MAPLAMAVTRLKPMRTAPGPSLSPNWRQAQENHGCNNQGQGLHENLGESHVRCSKRKKYDGDTGADHP